MGYQKRAKKTKKAHEAIKIRPLTYINKEFPARFIFEDFEKPKFDNKTFTLFLDKSTLKHLDSGSCIKTRSRGRDRSNVSVCKEGDTIKIFKIDDNFSRKFNLSYYNQKKLSNSPHKQKNKVHDFNRKLNELP
jgi:hypothetical protein